MLPVQFLILGELIKETSFDDLIRNIRSYTKLILVTCILSTISFGSKLPSYIKSVNLLSYSSAK